MEIASTITQVAVPVSEPNQAGEARRAAKYLARTLRFDEEQAEKLSIIVTEAATNLVKHGGGGEVLICPVDCGNGESHIDVLAIDRGKGISDLGRSIEDGYSTAGSPGTGLGAIQRLSETFDIYSAPGKGTVLLARVASNKRVRAPEGNASRFQVGFICFPMRGEQVSGDSVALRLSSNIGWFLVADGLGHGIAAAAASAKACKVFAESREDTVGGFVEDIHAGLRSTRGAAVAVAQIDGDRGVLRYAGVGNIAGAIVLRDASSRSLVSHNGIAGHQSHRIQEFSYQWPESGVLVMNSDGLVTNWRLNQYPGLLQKDPTVIAAMLYRDFNRGRDDVSVLVVRGTPALA